MIIKTDSLSVKDTLLQVKDSILKVEDEILKTDEIKSKDEVEKKAVLKVLSEINLDSLKRK